MFRLQPESLSLTDRQPEFAAPLTQPILGVAEEVDSPASIDRLTHAIMGRLTSSISPASLALAYFDWGVHLAESPGKWAQLTEKAVRKAVRLAIYTGRVSSGLPTEPCIQPLPQDRRFNGPGWKHWPFNVIQQAFLLEQQWWHKATTGVGGVSQHHEQVVSFATRQLLDMVSPVNFVPTNPEVLDAAIQEGGQNFVLGTMNFLEDWERAIGGSPPVGTERFQPGKQVAVTEGSVVFRNRLIELIQYAPTTPDVHAEPVLIVPAWIMKYYILDLSPHNSLVKYLVDRGHTVFMISWHNPHSEDRDMGMHDYMQLGVFDAIRAVRAIVPNAGINTVGYCLGGTLLSIAAASLAQKDDSTVNSMTLFAAQTDFTEAGELRLFIDDSQLNYLEDIMWDQGYLDNRQMAGAFQLLRSHDLIWSRIVNQYMLGRHAPMTDLLAWNADATRMPFKMQSEYLRSLFLNNDLFAGRYKVHGRPVSLSDIRSPMFVVATEADHVAPWHSVYKINLLADTNVTFLLTNGGHNAGIVSEPGHKGRHYRLSHWLHGGKYIDADNWYINTPVVEGSWWPVWADWLEERSQGRVAPPAMGAPELGYRPLEPAPGMYVLER
ncbi:MAG: poly[(R)-3-hydroxyalkanoate] polymerase subunit PhaC [Burkholderiales bacterium]|jgi:polyhydroxyalkanoate synthase